MLFIDWKNSNKMAAVYTVHARSIQICNCLYFLNVTIKKIRSGGQTLFQCHKLN